MTELIFLPYLQQWDGTHLSLNLLAAPQGSPLDPLVPAGPAFADANFTFEIRLVQGLGSLPTTGSPYTALTQVTTAPPQARPICQALAAALPIDPTITAINPRAGGQQFLKYAPPGYRAAAGYADGGNPYLRVDDSYHCALKSGVPAGTVLQSAPPPLGWGKVLAAALRQPLMSQAIGLVRPFTFTPAAHFFEAGGWVYITLAAGSDDAGLLAVPGGLKSYAARVPVLSKARSLFTSVLFPVAASVPAADYDDLFIEVVNYDDGFAKAIYAAQPIVLDPLGETDDGTRPRTDHGARLGWDDEQVATWLNRQIDPNAAVQDAPMGVLGYRVDARKAGETTWSSLVLGSTEVTIGSLDLGSYQGEFRVEVVPNQLMSDTTGTFWIPSYYASWTGTSLVGRDRTQDKLQGIDSPSVVEGADPGVSLRYGDSYEFRVRLVDHTGGGPALDEDPVNPAPQPVAPLTFLRWVRPQPLIVDTTLPIIPDPANAPDTITVQRPLMGYPEYIFAGGSVTDMLADLPAASAAGRAVGLPDPDVDMVQVQVSVAFPGPADSPGDNYQVLYQATRPFPPGATDPLVLTLDWQDVADATTITDPGTGPLPVPTARLLRIAVNALAAERTGYYGSDDVRQGPQTTLAVTKYSSDETHLLRAVLADPVEGIFLQPDAQVTPAVALAQQAAGLGLAAPDNPLGRLASALNLAVAGARLRANTNPGERVLFGCSPDVAHSLGPDGGSIQFASVNDLTLVWIVAIRLELSRDWSWDGLDHLSIRKAGVEVGQVEPRLTVAAEALDGAPTDHSDIIFFDIFDPKPPPGQFPAELELTYTVHPVFRNPPASSDPDLSFDLHLPITTPPSDVPKLASAGIALSPYTRDDAYSYTSPRQRTLWFEFATPPANGADSFYARVLAYAPDPVLTDVDPVPEAAEPPLPIDPEPIRTIVPGQSDDQAGASAMQLLQPTSSPVHFYVPLPAGTTPDSAELFGFFTYELRVGHTIGWSTAQGRFGRPLRVTGVQHPAPALTVSVIRSKSGIEVSAPVADPVYQGESLLPYPPVTQLWVLLYTQVHQADDTDMRNLLLDSRQAYILIDRWKNRFAPLRADTGTATWSEGQLDQMLGLLGLSPDAALSCLVVETLPGEQPVADPVGAGLGYERFLRTSPLTAIPVQC
ncbi:MAG TPA: hypothetical protein VIY52_30250 [Streptosporangiaceae bacterium]